MLRRRGVDVGRGFGAGGAAEREFRCVVRRAVVPVVGAAVAEWEFRRVVRRAVSPVVAGGRRGADSRVLQVVDFRRGGRAVGGAVVFAGGGVGGRLLSVEAKRRVVVAAVCCGAIWWVYCFRSGVWQRATFFSSYVSCVSRLCAVCGVWWAFLGSPAWCVGVARRPEDGQEVGCVLFS